MQWSSDISTWFHTYSPSGWSVSSQNARDGNGTLAGWFLPSGPGRNPRLVFTVSPRGISGWHFFERNFGRGNKRNSTDSTDRILNRDEVSWHLFWQIVYVIRIIHDKSKIKQLKQSMDVERCIRTPSICTHLMEHRMRYLALPLRAFASCLACVLLHVATWIFWRFTCELPSCVFGTWWRELPVFGFFHSTFRSDKQVFWGGNTKTILVSSFEGLLFSSFFSRKFPVVTSMYTLEFVAFSKGLGTLKLLNANPHRMSSKLSSLFPGILTAGAGYMPT